MRALFVNRLTGSECLGRQPLGILYLSAALKRDGHEVGIADACRPSEVRRAVRELRPHVLLYSVRTGYHRFYARLNRELKREFPDVLSIFGGPHATFYPEMIEQDDAVDAVCIGEGELALCDFFARLQAGSDWDAAPNFWTRRDGRLRRNAVRPLAPDIDSLPEPDRELLAPFPVLRRFPIRSFIASRGCPYDCTYCFNHAYARIYEGKGARVRLPSPRRFVDEIAREARRAPFSAAQFEDDIFGMSPRWLEEFAALYPSAVGLPFSCNVRAELVTDRVADLLAKAGCAGVWLGLESGDEQVRSELLDRQNSDEVTRSGVARLKARGLAVSTENIVGIPKTTLEHDFKTLALNCELRPNYAQCSIFQPYPRTDLGRVAAEAGLFSGNFDELGDFYEGTSLRVPHRRELENLQELFAVIVRFPRLLPLAPRLVRLPLHPLYRLANLALKVLVLTREFYPVRLRLEHLRHLAQLLGQPLQPARGSAFPSDRPSQPQSGADGTARSAVGA